MSIARIQKLFRLQCYQIYSKFTLASKKTLFEVSATLMDNVTNIDSNRFNNLSKEQILQLKFFCDGTLWRVSKHLRLLGIDCLFDAQFTTPFILYFIKKEYLESKTKRIIITRNKHLLRRMQQWNQRIQKTLEPEEEPREEVKEWLFKREQEKLKKIQQQHLLNDIEEEEEDSEGECLETNDLLVKELFIFEYLFIVGKGWKDQIDETVAFFRIPFFEDKIFSRCLACNSIIEKVESKESIKHLLFESVYNEYENFYRCTKCPNKFFWGNDPQKKHVNFQNAQMFAKEHSWPSVIK